MTDEASSKDGIEALRRMIDAAERIVALTGAGISTESGIPDFRGPNGIWKRVKPITYQEFVASEAARLEDWRRRFVMNEAFRTAQPNTGHLGLARLAAEGRLDMVITQNIDGLHQRAGLPAERLIEIHGNATHGRCLACGTAMTLLEVRRQIDSTGASPRCACNGIVKAAIISFGEQLPQHAMAKAIEHTRAADLFLVLGSSLQVRPAAALPQIASAAGARLIIINREPTPIDASATLLLRGGIGETFERLLPQLVN